MPYINGKISEKLSDNTKEVIKSRFGKAISIIPGKSEQRLMFSLEDNCFLYFQGNNDEETAFIEVKIFGTTDKENFNKLTGELTKIICEETNVPSGRVFISYQEFNNWGYNGRNL